MQRTILIALCLAAGSGLQAADSQWVLEKSTLTYHVSHPLHQIDGISHAARGKGICHDGECEYLIAAPVKSFESGDSNRDLHMLQVARGAQFPIVTVRLKLPESAASLAEIHADLEIEFAGRTAGYGQVTLHQESTGGEAHITGTIPARMTDFKIEPPSLLAIRTKDEIPVKVDMIWRRM